MTTNYAAEHKVPTYTVRQMTNQDPDFYAVVGPMLARRDIVAELGSPVWDDDDKTWQIALTEKQEVLGMVGVRNGEVCSFYVTPGSRGLSIGYAILHRAITKCEATKATVSDASLALFEQAGFVETGRRGRYHAMRKA